jgi:hypothetical protein
LRRMVTRGKTVKARIWTSRLNGKLCAEANKTCIWVGGLFPAAAEHFDGGDGAESLELESSK